MSKFKGTKGVWKVNHSESKTAFNVVGTVLGGNYKIARCPYLIEDSMSKEWNKKEKSECEANAKLIASAPDLLEALQKVYQIENHAFGLKGFDVERFKSEIKTVLDKATE